MKKIILMLIVVASMTACSKDGQKGDEGYKQKLNILTSIDTRAIIAGTTMPQGSAIGVHITQGAGGTLAKYAGQNYVAGGQNLEFGDNVRFDNAAVANKWVSQKANNDVANLMIGAQEGTVYGYYPYATTVTGLGAAATIPATVLTTGDIDLSSAAAGSKNYAAAEVDYLYYKPAATRATVKSSSTTTASLTMAHAMASVSFRMYVSSDAPTVNDGDNNYYLMGYTIKNKQGKTLFKANTSSVTMNIADGAMTIPSSGGEIVRTLNTNNGYVLTRVQGATATQVEKDALVWISNLTFPIASISHQVVDGVDVSDDIEIVFSIKKGLSGTPENRTVPLVVKTGDADPLKDSDRWLAGNNYQYTIKYNGFNPLEIEQVTVTDWVNVVGGDITID